MILPILTPSGRFSTGPAVFFLCRPILPVEGGTVMGRPTGLER